MEHPRKTSSSSGTARDREDISPSEIDHSTFTFQAPTPNSRTYHSAPLPRLDETRPRSSVDPSIDHSIHIFSDRATRSSRADCLRGDPSQNKLPSDAKTPITRTYSTAVPKHRHKSPSAAATPSSTARLPRADRSSHKSPSSAATPSSTAGLPRADRSSHKSPSAAATPSSTARIPRVDRSSHKSPSSAATPSSTAGLPRADRSSHKSPSAAATPSSTARIPRVDRSSHKSPSSAATPSSTAGLPRAERSEPLLRSGTTKPILSADPSKADHSTHKLPSSAATPSSTGDRSSHKLSRKDKSSLRPPLLPPPLKPISTADRSTTITYRAGDGTDVCISFPVNPWKILGLSPDKYSRYDVKQAFRKKINESGRQNRALTSLANHILTSTDDARYQRHKNLFTIKNRDHFTIAAYGNTDELKVLIRRDSSLLTTSDEHGRTLLYFACKSGFYDMVETLLQKGADVNKIQRDNSTPLHVAAFYGHDRVVILLLDYGARTDIKNASNQTALEESHSTEIKNCIQNALSDFIFCEKAKLMKAKLVSEMRPVTFNGRIIAKELIRHPSRFDERTRSKLSTILKTWKLTWHGTKLANVQSILAQGLLPAGSAGITPPPGHFRLGETFYGVENWAAAIFVSPSLMYSAHAAYSERITSGKEQWCVLIKTYCRPESYKAYDPTVLSYEGMDGETPSPEYRVTFNFSEASDDNLSEEDVPVLEEDKKVILRVESARNVIVRSVMFIRASVLESQEMKFRESQKLFKK